MYTVEFYEKADGNSELWDFLEDLRKKAANNKDARIQYKQISLYIELLQLKVLGCRIILPNILKKIFGSFVRATIEYSTLLSRKHFRTAASIPQKVPKTPKREIEKAKAERDDYLRRKETADL